MLCSKHARFTRSILIGNMPPSAALAVLKCRPMSTTRGEQKESDSTGKSDANLPVPSRPGEKEADLELPPLEATYPKPVIRKYDSVKLPGNARKATPDRVAMMARIERIFDKHDRTRAGFMAIVDEYLGMDKMLRGHPEFINTAVERMEEFGVQKDFDCYRRVLDCFPEGRYVPKSYLAEILPTTFAQSEAAYRLMRKMDMHGVLPNYELVEKVTKILGWRSVSAQYALDIGWWKSMFQDNDQYYIPSASRYRPFLMAGFVLKRMAGKASSVQVVRVR